MLMAQAKRPIAILRKITLKLEKKNFLIFRFFNFITFIIAGMRGGRKIKMGINLNPSVILTLNQVQHKLRSGSVLPVLIIKAWIVRPKQTMTLKKIFTSQIPIVRRRLLYFYRNDSAGLPVYRLFPRSL